MQIRGRGRLLILAILLWSAFGITVRLSAQNSNSEPVARSTELQAPPSQQPSPTPSAKLPDPRFEFAGVLSGFTGNGIGNDFGVGGRFSYTYSEDPGGDVGTLTALEAEVNWLPVNKAPDVFHGGRALEVLFGVAPAVGDTGERAGVKLRSGFIRSIRAVTALTSIATPSGTEFVPSRFGPITNPVLEFGAFYERFRVDSHWGLRFDVGDLVVFYPDLPARGFRVRHHFEASIALAYRFPMKGK